MGCCSMLFWVVASGFWLLHSVISGCFGFLRWWFLFLGFWLLHFLVSALVIFAWYSGFWLLHFLVSALVISGCFGFLLCWVFSARCFANVNRVSKTRFPGGRYVEKVSTQTWSEPENQASKTRFIGPKPSPWDSMLLKNIVSEPCLLTI